MNWLDRRQIGFREAMQAWVCIVLDAYQGILPEEAMSSQVLEGMRAEGFRVSADAQYAARHMIQAALNMRNADEG